MKCIRDLALLLSCVIVCGAGCESNTRKVPQGTASGEVEVVGETWPVCAWLGPSTSRPGVFGTDLGYEAPLPAATPGASEQLQLLFGDTYAEATDACLYPVLNQDDLAARVPIVRPEVLAPGRPDGTTQACDMLQFTVEDPQDSTSWRPIRLFPDATDRNPDRALDTGLNRTPLTAWSDGEHTFTIYYRDEFARCDTHADCPGGASCSSDPDYRGKHIGGCTPHTSLSSDASPAFCRDGGDCSGPSLCTDLDRGVCIANTPFDLERDGQNLSPDWYQKDPRDGIVAVLRIASAFWPERPEDYATGFRFATKKFVNLTARTVAHFDPEHPERNDYSPGHETLLVWGRPAFVGHDGFQALPFLLYQPLSNFIDDAGNIAWAPRYFAGYDQAGNPRWSDAEADAQPIYGVQENLRQGADGGWTWRWDQPEFDYVNQFSMAYVEPLERWIMLYGGESPAEVDPAAEARPKRTHPQRVPGAVHLRAALHPWGRARASDPASEGYAQPRPVLTPKALAKHIACSDEPVAGECNPDLPQTHADVIEAVGSAVTDFSFGDILEASAKCAAGGELIDSQYTDHDAGGHLYGSAIIHSWTHEVTDALPDLSPGDRAVELFWNVSTWNPYQALLMKTQLRKSDFEVR